MEAAATVRTNRQLQMIDGSIVVPYWAAAFLAVLGLLWVLHFAIMIVPEIWRSDEWRRRRDRRQLWPEFRYYMQDRDHAVAAMTMHMMIADHWWPPEVSWDDDEALFVIFLEQALAETEGWGEVNRHFYPVMPTERIPDKEGMLYGSDTHREQQH